MNRLRAPLYRLLLGLLLCLPLVASAFEVALVVSQRSGPYEVFTETFVRAAAAAGHRVIDAGSVDGTLDDALIARADIVIANGEAALAAVLQRPAGPTLGVMLGRERFNALRKRFPLAELSAFTLDQPAERQLRLLRAVLPDSQRIGVLFGEAMLSGRELQAVAPEAGFGLLASVVSKESELIAGLETVLRGSDAFIAIPDPLLSRPSSARTILLTSYRFQKPVIAFSRAYVEAGALAAVFSTPESVAADVASWLDAGSGKTLKLPGLRGPASFEIAVNRQVARALGIRVPDDNELRRLTAGGEKS